MVWAGFGLSFKLTENLLEFKRQRQGTASSKLFWGKTLVTKMITVESIQVIAFQVNGSVKRKHFKEVRWLSG